MKTSRKIITFIIFFLFPLTTSANCRLQLEYFSDLKKKLKFSLIKNILEANNIDFEIKERADINNYNLIISFDNKQIHFEKDFSSSYTDNIIFLTYEKCFPYLNSSSNDKIPKSKFIVKSLEMSFNEKKECILNYYYREDKDIDNVVYNLAEKIYQRFNVSLYIIQTKSVDSSIISIKSQKESYITKPYKIDEILNKITTCRNELNLSSTQINSSQTTPNTLETTIQPQTNPSQIKISEMSSIKSRLLTKEILNHNNCIVIRITNNIYSYMSHTEEFWNEIVRVIKLKLDIRSYHIDYEDDNDLCNGLYLNNYDFPITLIKKGNNIKEISNMELQTIEETYEKIKQNCS